MIIFHDKMKSPDKDYQFHQTETGGGQYGKSFCDRNNCYIYSVNNLCDEKHRKSSKSITIQKAGDRSSAFLCGLFLLKNSVFYRK